MEKYQLSVKGLRSLFDQLLNAGAVPGRDLENRMAANAGATADKSLRRRPRHYMFVPLPVYALDNLAEEGSVVDISEQGLRTIGVEVRKGEYKELLIQADGYADIYPFQIEARCCWVNPDTDSGLTEAGFEITDTNQGSLQQLRTLIRTLCLGISGTDSPAAEGSGPPLFAEDMMDVASGASS
ncbi:MAG: PilZ domain-containing protein [Pseudomonadota bacterium]